MISLPLLIYFVDLVRRKSLFVVLGFKVKLSFQTRQHSRAKQRSDVKLREKIVTFGIICFQNGNLKGSGLIGKHSNHSSSVHVLFYKLSFILLGEMVERTTWQAVTRLKYFCSPNVKKM